jgi:D-inositol-3-phosphate glycosyltransferase
MSAPRLLFNGDAGVPTGFARVTHQLLATARLTYDVRVLGVNYFGEPHDHPYPIHPAQLGGDPWGIGRIKSMIEGWHPDVTVIQNDPWNVADFLKYVPTLKDSCTLALMPLDGDNCASAQKLNGLRLALWYTRHAAGQARAGGFQGRSEVLTLGVDTDRFQPGDRLAARKRWGLDRSLPADAFIVGVVNRNQPRKRHDLTLAWFADWVLRQGIDNAWLYLHLAVEDSGWNVRQLAKFFGIDNRLIITKSVNPAVGIGDDSLAALYQTFDVQVTTTQGEGWGLTTMEGMACGIPQVVPDWSGLGEWTGDAVVKVAIGEIAVTPNGINVVGGVPAREPWIAALHRYYSDLDFRLEMGARARAHVLRPEFDWTTIGARFVALLESARQEQPHGTDTGEGSTDTVDRQHDHEGKPVLAGYGG